jgi:hypothetical protein
MTINYIYYNDYNHYPHRHQRHIKFNVHHYHYHHLYSLTFNIFVFCIRVQRKYKILKLQLGKWNCSLQRQITNLVRTKNKIPIALKLTVGAVLHTNIYISKLELHPTIIASISLCNFLFSYSRLYWYGRVTVATAGLGYLEVS